MIQSFSPRLFRHAKNAAQFTALLFAAVYACGFVVVTFSQARLGIVEFSPIRPRIISAGVSFIFFTTLPLILGFNWIKQSLSRWKAPSTAENNSTVSPPHPAWGVVADVVSYPIFAYFAAYPFTFLFATVDASEEVKFGYRAIAPWVGGWFLILLFLNRMRYPNVRGALSWVWIFALSAMASIPMAFLLHYVSTPPNLLWLALWFIGAPLAVPVILWQFQNKEFQFAFPTIVAVLTVYSSGLYPLIKPQFGGGRAVPVVVFLAEKNPLGDPNTRIDARLVDEVDQGFYLQPAHEDTAYFIPRQSVAALQFLPQR